jgi:hypothetical protein
MGLETDVVRGVLVAAGQPGGAGKAEFGFKPNPATKSKMDQ